MKTEDYTNIYVPKPQDSKRLLAYLVDHCGYTVANGFDNRDHRNWWQTYHAAESTYKYDTLHIDGDAKTIYSRHKDKLKLDGRKVRTYSNCLRLLVESLYPVTKEPISIQNVGPFTAVVEEDRVRVGCQNIPHAVALALNEAIDKFDSTPSGLKPLPKRIQAADTTELRSLLILLTSFGYKIHNNGVSVDYYIKNCGEFTNIGGSGIVLGGNYKRTNGEDWQFSRDLKEITEFLTSMGSGPAEVSFGTAGDYDVTITKKRVKFGDDYTITHQNVRDIAAAIKKYNEQ